MRTKARTFIIWRQGKDLDLGDAGWGRLETRSLGPGLNTSLTPELLDTLGVPTAKDYRRYSLTVARNPRGAIALVALRLHPGQLWTNGFLGVRRIGKRRHPDSVICINSTEKVLGPIKPGDRFTVTVRKL